MGAGDRKNRSANSQGVFSLQRGFRDTEETVVIIDEIQEPSEVYNLVRDFTRKFKCRFIITGRYLGRTLNKEFKMSAGDLTSLRIETLDFEELQRLLEWQKHTGVFD